jgi:hypothetical protein
MNFFDDYGWHTMQKNRKIFFLDHKEICIPSDGFRCNENRDQSPFYQQPTFLETGIYD